jgi:hypothetical protein
VCFQTSDGRNGGRQLLKGPVKQLRCWEEVVDPLLKGFREAIDLAVGSRGLGGITRALIGSVADSVARLASKCFCSRRRKVSQCIPLGFPGNVAITSSLSPLTLVRSLLIMRLRRSSLSSL